MIDFVVSVPELISKTVTRHKSINGCLENEMIDSKIFRYPDYNKMLTTCKLDPSESEYKLCVGSFPYFFKIYQEKGHVEDEVFE